jgi:hypothetical protein
MTATIKESVRFQAKSKENLRKETGRSNKVAAIGVYLILINKFVMML